MRSMSERPIALISGATSGIGEACAHLLAKNQYRLILTGRREDRLLQMKEELMNTAEVLTLSFDIREEDAVQYALSTLPEDWKGIDVLINNAGLAAGLSVLHEGSTSDWNQMIDTNVKGLLYLSRQVIPRMTERRKGHVINIGSIAGKEVYDKGNVYCGTKHMVDALSKGMRSELAEYGIRVTAIHPGAVETEFSLVRFKGDSERADAVYVGFEPLLANDIADAVLWSLQRPSHVNINEMTIMPQAQPTAGKIIRK